MGSRGYASRSSSSSRKTLSCQLHSSTKAPAFSRLRKEQKAMGIEEEDEPIHSPVKQPSRHRRGTEKDSDLNRTFTSMGSKDLGASPNGKEARRDADGDADSVADSLMAAI